MDDQTLKVAAFVVQALGLEEDARALAAEVGELKRDLNAGIYTLQLDSSVGPAAFLVYAYDLDRAGEDGATGRALFDAGLATLQAAAERDAPGPRLLAHALTDDAGYILATTPATFRALTGDAPIEAIAPTDADLLSPADTAATRRVAAGDLLRLLRDADAQAAAWLGALRAEGRLAAGERGGEYPADTLTFNVEETALALFLLDERSIGHLLQALDLLLIAARAQTAGALGRPDA